MNETSSNTQSFVERSTQTALGIAYRRTFMDIPFADQVFEIAQKILGPMNPQIAAMTEKTSLLTPFFESRYRVTQRVIEDSGVRQVLELASGLSTHGLCFAQDPTFHYVETDLPEMSSPKCNIINIVRQGIDAKRVEEWKASQHPPDEKFDEHAVQNNRNLRIVPANILESVGMSIARMNLNRGRVGVICEGFLRYVSWPHKHFLDDSLRDMFAVYKGGVWVTPDIEFLSDANSTPEMIAKYDMFAAELGFDVRPNLFRDMDHALEFFGADKQPVSDEFPVLPSYEVEVIRHDAMIDELVSIRRLGLNEDEVLEELKKHYTFVMRPII